MAKKKRSKKDIILGLDMDFENAMRVALGGEPNSKNMDNQQGIIHSGTVLLSPERMEYPSSSDNTFISTKQFNAIQIKGVIKGGKASVKFSLVLEAYSIDLNFDPTTHQINKIIPVPFPTPGFVVFNFKPNDKIQKEDCYAKFEFKLVSLNQHELDRLLKI